MQCVYALADESHKAYVLRVLQLKKKVTKINQTFHAIKFQLAQKQFYVDALRLSQQFFGHVWTLYCLPGLNKY